MAASSAVRSMGRWRDDPLNTGAKNRGTRPPLTIDSPVSYSQWESMLRLTKGEILDGKMLLGVDPYLIFLGSLSCCLPAALSRHGHVRAAVQRGFGGAARGTADVVRPGTTAVLGSVAEAPPLILNCINLKSV
jgi:hypothetical protein